jgi:hypothetical protein
MARHSLQLQLFSEKYALCRLSHSAGIPLWAHASDFFSITRTPEELSIVCQEAVVPSDQACERGWRCLQVLEPIDLAMTGVLASLTEPLANAQISLFAIATYDTDYLLVKEEILTKALQALQAAGHEIRSRA